jgi:dolichol-phosphate mannosyltransferase
VVRDVYVPAKYGDETSHLSIMRTLRQFPGSLLLGFLRRLWIQYFVRDFGLCSLYLVGGAALTAFGAIFGATHWWLSAQKHVVTPTGTVMLAVLPIILGVQLLLQATGLEIQNQPTHCLHQDCALTQEPAENGP